MLSGGGSTTFPVDTSKYNKQNFTIRHFFMAVLFVTDVEKLTSQFIKKDQLGH